jgi:outer membrane protein OmpA-like peptidoglycan-associated protein
MKRFFALYSIVASILAVTTVSAQDVVTTKDSRVSNFEVTRANGKLTIDMDIDISSLEIGSDETFVITPVIINDNNMEKLSAIEIMGRRAYLYSKRNDAQTVTDNPFYSQRKAKRAERKAGQKQSVAYNATTPFAEWMRGGKVQLNMGSCGCDPWVEYVGTDDAGDVGQEIYNPSYICSYIAPEPEPVKIRADSLSAYINFWVDRVNILDNYMDNARELASIVNSIERVAEDEDYSIMSIKIDGWASPEAPLYHNIWLAENRAKALRDYVSKKVSVDGKLITSEGHGENWPGFKKYVLAHEDLMWRDEVLAIIDDASLSEDEKNQKILVSNPEAYRYYLDNIYPILRRSDYVIRYKIANFDVEVAKVILKKTPEKLSVDEIYKVAGTYEVGSEEYNFAIETAAKVYPTDVPAMVNYVRRLVEEGKLDEALSELKRSKRGDKDIQAVEGYIHLLKGEYDIARAFIVAAAAAGSEDAKHNLAELDKYEQSL